MAANAPSPLTATRMEYCCSPPSCTRLPPLPSVEKKRSNPAAYAAKTTLPPSSEASIGCPSEWKQHPVSSTVTPAAAAMSFASTNCRRFAPLTSMAQIPRGIESVLSLVAVSRRTIMNTVCPLPEMTTPLISLLASVTSPRAPPASAMRTCTLSVETTVPPSLLMSTTAPHAQSGTYESTSVIPLPSDPMVKMRFGVAGSPVPGAWLKTAVAPSPLSTG